MGLIDEIKMMQQEGRSDQEIFSTLTGQGFPAKDVQESMTQARIKEAIMAEPGAAPNATKQVTAPEALMPSVLDQNQPQQASSQDYSAMNQTYGNNYQEEEPYSPQQAPSPYSSPSLPAPPQPQSSYPYDNSPQQYESQELPQTQQDSYSYASSGLSVDTLNEISEQILVEKLSPIKNKIEEISNFKNVIESKIDYLDERLKRIEKTIDRLQLSVLQKVGDYITNVEDIKKELIETQKTFKALVPSTQNSFTTQPKNPQPSQSKNKSPQEF